MPTTIRQDLEDQFSWDTILTSFDEEGNLTSRFIFYDNGITRDDEFADGVLRSRVMSDAGTDENDTGVRSWDRIEMIYDENGDLTERYQLNDNGIQILQSYDAGVLRLKTEVDLGQNGEQSDAARWEFRYSYYDANGNLERMTETRDDGVEIATEFENGVRRYQEQIDLGPNGEASDARAWERLEITYDEAGLLESRYELRDDGVQIGTLYDAGVRRYQEELDVGPAGEASDARAWERIETTYDENGDLQSRYELRDDGVQIGTQYEAGVRRAQEQLDVGPNGEPSDARNWERIEISYDSEGQIESRYELRDNGIQIATSYENGVRRFQEQVDVGPSGEPSDAARWERIESQYDETGAEEFRFELRDNGVTIETQFQDGKRIEVTQQDLLDAEAWDYRLYLYNQEGQLDARETFFDNGDVTANFYEDGVRTARYDLDGDGSEAWETREILYNPDGSVAEINYDVNLFNDPVGF